MSGGLRNSYVTLFLETITCSIFIFGRHQWMVSYHRIHIQTWCLTDIYFLWHMWFFLNFNSRNKKYFHWTLFSETTNHEITSLTELYTFDLLTWFIVIEYPEVCKIWTLTKNQSQPCIKGRSNWLTVNGSFILLQCICTHWLDIVKTNVK